jgi:hypothetical protein
MKFFLLGTSELIRVRNNKSMEINLISDTITKPTHVAVMCSMPK